MKRIEDEAKPLAYSVHQLSRLTSVSTQTIYQEIKDGNIKAKRIGTRFIIPAAAAEEWLSR